MSTLGVMPIVERMTDVLVEALRPQAVVLFGSFAKGSAKPTSDIDLLVVWETPLPPMLRERSVLPLLHNFGIPVDAVIRTPAEVAQEAMRCHSFVHSVLRSGQTVYQDEGYSLPVPADPRGVS